jgi:hypothetical protein
MSDGAPFSVAFTWGLGPGSVYGLMRPQVVKSTPGTLTSINVRTPGTVGAFKFNDCNSLAEASLSNEILVVDGTIAGETTFSIPFLTGLVLSVTPTGNGLPSAQVTYG